LFTCPPCFFFILLSIRSTDNISCTLIAPPGGTGYLWYDSTVGPTNYINAAGDYYVSYLIDCTEYVDTFKVGVAYNPADISGPDTLCLGNSGELVDLKRWRYMEQ